jgi:transposase-like protein
MDFKFKSLIELSRYFKDEKTCYDFLESQIWNDGKACCPHCGSTHVYTRSNRSKNPAKEGVREYKCAEKGCNKNFTATVGTIFESSKLPLQTWFCAIWLCTTTSKGISSANLAKQLGITQKSAWFVLSRIREMFAQTAPHMLTGEVEIDETYVGGKEKNKHSKKRKDKQQGGAGKETVVGLVQRDGSVIVKHVPDATRNTILPVIEKHVEPKTKIATDEYAMYQTLWRNYDHSTVNHRNGLYVIGWAHTNTIEGFWSQLKRGIIGVYHFTSPKHLQRYCNEYAYRYNTRQLSSVEKFATAVQNVIKARITYVNLTK